MRINFEQFPVLETKRLILKQITSAQVSELSLILSDPEVAKHDYFHPTTSEDEVMKFIERYQSEWESEEEITWGIFTHESHELIGTCGLGNLCDVTNKAEIGYAVRRSEWGKGYATEAIAAVVKYGFESAELNRIEALITPGNDASVVVLEKNGFLREGLVRERDMLKGQLVDSFIMGQLKRDYSK